MTRKKRIRWWPAVLIVVLALMAVLGVQFGGDRSGQEKVVFTLLITVLTFLLLLLWLILGSRLPWGTRLKAVLGVVLVSSGLGLLFEIKGVTGNLLPILGWRWASAPPDSKAGQKAIRLGKGGVAETDRLSYPRFLGPGSNATLSGPVITTDWESEPPRELWRRSVGAGWSAFAVSAGLALTQEQQGDEEQVVAYDLMSGDVVWRHTDIARYETTLGGVGPRATPTVSAGRVYTLGATGILNAFELTTGERIWTTDILSDAGAQNQEWGKSGSPLIVKDLVVVSAGGQDGKSMLAYHRDTGELVWMGGNDRSGYSSPGLATIAGEEQILILNYSSVASHAPDTGEVLWEYPWPKDFPNVAQPVPISPDTILVSSGYGVGSKLLRVSKQEEGTRQVELIWRSPRLKAKFANFVVFEGNVYGLDDGVLVCLDPVTGERRWKKGRYGHGQLLLVAENLLVLSEAGVLTVVSPNPTGLIELGSVKVLEGKTWNNPALAGPYLLVRNHREAAMYELPTGDG
jgi:outer membrane protein assembly factor BamB